MIRCLGPACGASSWVVSQAGSRKRGAERGLSAPSAAAAGQPAPPVSRRRGGPQPRPRTQPSRKRSAARPQRRGHRLNPARLNPAVASATSLCRRPCSGPSRLASTAILAVHFARSSACPASTATRTRKDTRGSPQPVSAQRQPAHVARGERQASRAAQRSRTWCLGRASQSDGWLAPPPAVRQGRALCGRPWKGLAAAPMARRPSSSSLEQRHVVEVQRTPRDRRFIIRTNNHSFRGLIAAALPPFPGQRLPKPSNLNFICDPRNTRAPSSTGDGFNCVSPFHVCEDFIFAGKCREISRHLDI